MKKPAIKAVLLQVHSLVGLVLALLFGLIGLTGAIMSFEDEIQAGLNAEISHVEARTTPRLAPDDLIARLQAEHGFGKVSAITLSNDPTAAVRIRFARNEDRSRPSSIYADPYDAHVLGEPRAADFFATVRRLHRWLLLPGDANGYGRQITGVVALALITMLITGLVLRWPHRTTSIRMWLKPHLTLRGRGLHRSLHSVIGTWVLPIYLVMTLTGLWYSFDWYKNGAVWLLARQPAAAPMASKSKADAKSQAKSDAKADAKADGKPDAKPLPLDLVWSTFLRNEGDHFATALLTLPPSAGTVVRIRSWPEEGATDGARDEFRIDAVTGRIVSSELYADKTIGERVLARVLDIHRGSILGWPGKLVFMLAAATMPLFVVTGLLLYLSRRRHQRMVRHATLGRLVPGE